MSKEGFGGAISRYAKRYFIDGMGAMARGLFATLLVGTIIGAVAQLLGLAVPADASGFGISVLKAVIKFLNGIAAVAKHNLVVGAAIGIAIAHGLKASPLVVFSAAVTGAVGYCAGIGNAAFNGSNALSYVSKQFAESMLITEATADTSNVFLIAGPIGSFIAAIVGTELGQLVSGKTKVDILVVPLVSILSGGLVGYLLGAPFALFIKWLAGVIGSATAMAPVPMGIIVSVLVGLILTAPISSAAICAMLFAHNIIDGLESQAAHGLMLAAGAATVGCCCQMVGFAVASYRENKMGGLVSQGIGTSMLQIPNILRHPAILIPPTLAAAILGPISTTILPMYNLGIYAGMGTCGFVGQIGTYITMLGMEGETWLTVTLKVLGLHIILPAAIAFGISELLRKIGWIKKDDMLLS